MANLVSGVATNTILSSFDILKREDIPKLFRSHGMNRAPFVMELHAMGSQAAMDQDIFYHWEDYYFLQSIQVSNAGSPAGSGPNASVVVPLNASMIDSGTTWIRVNTTVKVGAANVVCQVIAKANDASTITIKPTNPTDTIPAVPANGFIGLVGNGKSRGSGQPESLNPKLRKLSHQFQIVSETTGSEGSLLAEPIWVSSTDYGQDLPKGFWSEQLIQAEYRQMVYESNTLTWQERSSGNNTDPTNNNRPIQYTEGFFPWALNNGLPLTVASGAFDLTSLATIAAYYKGQFANNHVYGKFGFDRYKELSLNLFDYFKNANIVAVGLERSKEMPGYDALAGYVNFEHAFFMNTCFTFSEYHELADPATSNYTGSNDPKLAAFFPVGMYKDPETGMLSPIIGYSWKQGHGYSRRMEVWRGGAAGGQDSYQYVGDRDEKFMYWRSEISSDYKLANQAVVVTV
jgi:hypothetical protein